jgi:hypothetical protein
MQLNLNFARINIIGGNFLRTNVFFLFFLSLSHTFKTSNNHVCILHKFVAKQSMNVLPNIYLKNPSIDICWCYRLPLCGWSFWGLVLLINDYNVHILWLSMVSVISFTLVDPTSTWIVAMVGLDASTIVFSLILQHH